MLRRIFLRKSKEILDQVESAEQILEKAQQKMEDLKKADNFTLIKIELLQLINQLGYHRYREGYSLSSNFSPLSEKNGNEAMELSKQIEECLNELKKIMDKENANTPNL